MARSRPVPAPVRFGTSGFRGVLGEGFTFDRAAALVEAVAADLPPRSRVVLTHDTRFLADRVAQDAAEILAAAGHRPVLGDRPTPTPAGCLAVRTRRAALGVLVTASHNPPEYLGIKLVGPEGGAVPRRMTDRIERHVARRWPRRREPARAGAPRSVDLVSPYLRHLGRHVPLESARGLVVAYDSLYGAGGGVLDRWLEDRGVRVAGLGFAPDPGLGGRSPDPSEVRLGDLSAEVRRRRARLGVATDGDADRFALVDERGARLPESDALALLIDHLARRGRIRRGVALSMATGSLPEQVARAHGLSVSRGPMGFSALTRELLAGRADVAGEESGGFAWAPVCVDKDGMLASALAVECAAEGPSLRERVAALHRLHGAAAWGRTAVPAEGGTGALAALAREVPARAHGQRVVAVREDDGLLCHLADGGFVMWRASGTEPLIRIYAEAPAPAALERRLAWARRRLGVRGRPS